MRISDWSSDVCSSDLDRVLIVVTLRREPDQLVVEIAHRGPAFDPTASPAVPDLDADLDERPIGGLGIHFAKTLLDSLSYVRRRDRSEEHTSELQSLMRISYAVFCLKKKNIY